MLLVAKTAAANCDHQMAKQQRCTQRRAAKMGLPTQVRHTKRSAHLLGNARLLCTLARHLGQIDLRAPMASSMLNFDCEHERPSCEPRVSGQRPAWRAIFSSTPEANFSVEARARFAYIFQHRVDLQRLRDRLCTLNPEVVVSEVESGHHPIENAF